MAYSALTDASGIASFPQIGEGAFSVQASFVDNTGTTTPVGSASGSVLPSNDGATVDIAIQEGTVGTVQGTVYASDGITPIPNAGIDIIDVASGLSAIPQNWPYSYFLSRLP